MEYFIEFLNQNNFWLMVLVFTFLLSKKWRIGGIFIVMILIFTGGTIPYWILGIISIITVFTTWLQPYNFFKRKYEKKVDDLYKSRRAGTV